MEGNRNNMSGILLKLFVIISFYINMVEVFVVT